VDDRALALRTSVAASLIRAKRLIVILRRVTPQSALFELVDELAEAGVRAMEVTFDAPSAADDLDGCRRRLPAAGTDACILGAGTIRTVDQLDQAQAVGAGFGVAPILDLDVLEAALDRGLPFIPGAYTPTEIELAWRRGATFVKVFPASSLGAAHLHELRAPLPEIETIPTGGIDAASAPSFLDAGAVAVGIGSAIVRAGREERRAIVAAVRDARPTPGS
jgi:2-dehydro-3-deoxyphosphogluconate aldolase / (4S)-4-hydroxy-2-oxoglutarate aldolase